MYYWGMVGKNRQVATIHLCNKMSYALLYTVQFPFESSTPGNWSQISQQYLEMGKNVHKHKIHWNMLSQYAQYLFAA